MKTLTSAERVEQAASLATALNAAKHKSPVSVLRALNIEPTLADREIIVTYARGDFWAGTNDSEFALRLGPSIEYATRVVNGLKLP